MLHYLKDLIGCKAVLSDNSLGSLEDLFYDPKDWKISYLLVSVGNWLKRRNILIYPHQVKQILWDKPEIQLHLSQSQIDQAPRLTSDPFDYYHWPYFWTNAGTLGIAATSEMTRWGRPPFENVQGLKNIHSVNGTLDFRVETYQPRHASELIGYVKDFAFDEEQWNIRYLLIDARSIKPNQILILSTRWIQIIQWDQYLIQMNINPRAVATCPQYNARYPITPRFEEMIERHYQRWLRPGKAA